MGVVLLYFISQITRFLKTAFVKLRERMENKGLFIINPRNNKTNLALKDYFFTIDF